MFCCPVLLKQNTSLYQENNKIKNLICSIVSSLVKTNRKKKKKNMRRFSLNIKSISSVRSITSEALDRATNARRAINALWSKHANDVVSPLAAGGSTPTEFNEASENIDLCASSVRQLMDQFKMTPQVARDEDITHALGGGFEKLLVLLVPLSPENVPYLERLLLMAARSQFEITIRTVQHLFARTRTYAEALTLFNLFRTCHVKMNMHAYYSMVYCLQRLEEESWAIRFREQSQERERTVSAMPEKERAKLVDPEDAAAPSLQALEFILRGCDNQLLPESKPWLGRIAFADAEPGVAPTKTSDFDALGSAWAKRFRGETDSQLGKSDVKKKQSQ